MAIEEQRVTVRNMGPLNGTGGDVWCYYLRGSEVSQGVYQTAKAARQAGERALKRLTP